MSVVRIGARPLTLEDVVNVARHGYKVELAQEAVERINRSRAVVDEFVDS